MEELNEKILTLTNYGTENEDDDPRKGKVIKARVTVAPHHVRFVIASFEPFAVIEGIDIRRVHVLMTDDQQMELYLSFLDLTILERAVGTYLLP